MVNTRRSPVRTGERYKGYILEYRKPRGRDDRLYAYWTIENKGKDILDYALTRRRAREIVNNELQGENGC